MDATFFKLAIWSYVQLVFHRELSLHSNQREFIFVMQEDQPKDVFIIVEHYDWYFGGFKSLVDYSQR